jgi:SAM-dependent methyltransferase
MTNNEKFISKNPARTGGTDSWYFNIPSFENASRTNINDSNGLSFQERWEKETPVFAEAILKRLPAGRTRILDYGCGVGRVAKEILRQRADITVVGTDTSDVHLNHARNYVADSRFSTCRPKELSSSFDLVYSIYVMQHVRATELQSTVARIHYWLANDGVFIDCSSMQRYALAVESGWNFVDDRFLGVDVHNEIARLFDPIGELFDEETLLKHVAVGKMVRGISFPAPIPPEDTDSAHPAQVYRKKEITIPYFDV